MPYTFCTLFDKNYLFKGLALHQSLVKYCREFTLWILCMDQETYSLLHGMNLENTRLIHLDDFEDEALRKAKQGRTHAEYCYTCASSLILYVMRQDRQSDGVAYLDSDLYFYGDPKPIYDEMADYSILIIGHRFSPEYQFMEVESGVYNVSMVIFRKNEAGLDCLTWWRDQCLRACYYDLNGGLCYDQKYLDDWPTRFRSVHVLQHKGAGLGPWNIRNYDLQERDGRIYVDSDELIFYHFHSLQILRHQLLNRRLFFTSKGGYYEFTRQQRALVYSPYLHELAMLIKSFKNANPNFDAGFANIDHHPQSLLHSVLRPSLNGSLLIV